MNSIPLSDSFQNDSELARLLNTATEKIEALQNESVSKVESDLGEVQNVVSLMRNRLIDYLRNSKKQDKDLDSTLKQVNTALSYIVGVEYPVSGIHMNHLVLSNKLLKNLPGIGKKSPTSF